MTEPELSNEEALALCVAQIAAGDRRAFDRLYSHTVMRMLAFARRLMQNDDAAEDCVAETYVRVWRDAAQYSRERGPVLAWLYTICRTRGLDLMRCARRQQAIEEAVFQELGGEEAMVEAEDLLGALDANAAITPLLAKMSPEQRRLIDLSFFQGLSHSDIAIATGMPLGTVKSHLHRAIATMRQALSIEPVTAR